MWSTKLWGERGDDPLTQNHWNGEDFFIHWRTCVWHDAPYKALWRVDSESLLALQNVRNKNYHRQIQLAVFSGLKSTSVAVPLPPLSVKRCSSDAMPVWGHVKMGQVDPWGSKGLLNLHSWVVTLLLITANTSFVLFVHMKKTFVLFFGIWYSCKSYTSI